MVSARAGRLYFLETLRRPMLAIARDSLLNPLTSDQTPRTPGLKHATATVFMSDDDADKLKELSDKGVVVYFQQTINDPRIEFAGIYSKFKR